MSLSPRQMLACCEACTMNQRPPRSFLKWAGGKRKIIPYILGGMEELSKLGENWHLEPGQHYHEPFLGSGSVFFAFKQANIIPQNSHSFLSDLNQVLTTTMESVQSPNLTDLKNELEQLRAAYLEEIRQEGFPSGMSADERNQRMYYQKRARMNQLISLLQKGGQLNNDQSLELASLMIFINKTCFNGLWRVSSDGLLNVPEGRYKNAQNIYQPDILEDCNQQLSAATIKHQSFKESFEEVKNGDLVYIDPPYVPIHIEDYVFTSYNSDGFTIQDQRDLAQEAANAVKRGARVIASNNDNAIVRDIYIEAAMEAGIPQPTFRTVPIKRTMSSKGDGRIEVNEVLIFMHPTSANNTFTLADIQTNQLICTQYLAQLPRNKSFQSVIDYAHTICPDLKQFCNLNRAKFGSLSNKDKGSMGKMAEFYLFGQLPNNSSNPDLAWGGDVKATHFKKMGKGRNSKERLTITNVGRTDDYSTFSALMASNDLRKNHYYKKLRRGVLLVFQYDKGTYNSPQQNLKKQLLFSFVYDLNKVDAATWAQLQRDLDDIQAKVKAKAVSQKGQIYMHIAPHDSGGRNVNRALCFTNKFLTKLVADNNNLPHTTGHSWYIDEIHF